jgi:hypothetical protein
MRRAIFAAIIACAAFGGSTVSAKQPSITGTWTFTVEHAGLRLIIGQKDRTVTGTLYWPHGNPIKITGGLAGDTLMFSGDSGGENFTIHIDSTGSIQEDGTLVGTLNTHLVDFNDAHEVVRSMDEKMPWTAMRGYRIAR